ncbi:MAG: PAS domain-containing protein [Sulfurimonadaceae bacterium]
MPHTLLTMLKKLQTMVFVPKNLSEGLKMLSIKNRYALIIYAFVLLEVSFFIVLTVSQESRTQRYLELKTTEAKSAYETVHHSFYKISEIVADSMGKDPRIIELLKEAGRADEQKKDAIAKKIERYLKKDFLNLKELYFQEFKFILPNDHSFLHLNRSELFGSAPTGRGQTDINLGTFHFRHSLFGKEKDLVSSVEFSLSSSIFTEDLEKLLETQLHFVDVKEIASLLQDDLENSPQTQEYLFNTSTMTEIALQTGSSKSFSMVLDDDENVGMVTFLAVERGNAQKRVDYFVYFKDDPKLAVLVGNYNVVQLLGSLLIAGVFSLVLIRINRKKEIANQVNKKTQELQESNQMLKERYELTLAGVGDGIWDWNLINETIYFSKRWKDMLGFAEDEIESTFDEWKNRVHPEDLQKAIIDITANMVGRTDKYENIHRLRHKDGRWIWILDRGKTIFDDDGNAVRMLGTHTDITEKKALEDKVAENEARLIEAQKIAHLGNWEWNLPNHKITWSDELYRVLGEEPQSFEPSYKSLLSYLSAQERTRYKKSMRKILKNMEPEYFYEWKIIRKDGSYSYVSSVIKMIYNKKGEAIQVNGTLLDITERKDAEEQLSLMNSMLVESYKKQKIKTTEVMEAKKELEVSHSKMMAAKSDAEQASRSKSEFLANMSHEIRTPLNAINGFIGLLKDNETDPEKLDYLGIVNSSSETLLQIINDILDFSKIESGKLIIEQLDFDPEKELSGTSELFKLKAAEKDIRLYIEGCDTLPSTLYGDVLRLKQILSNLLSNAIKFTDNSGEVVCMFRYEDGRLCLNVKDNGIGIPKDKQKMIFDSFTQADGSTVRKYGGTGLGLTISVKLAKLLDGDLSVVSKEGVGSEFFFSAPFALSKEKDEANEVSVEKSIELTGHTLLVEDNEANQMFIGIILRNAGLTYDIANNGIEAIEKFKTEKYKLILMDENMPKLNGIGATKEILQMEKEQGLEHTPIIALTANALVGDRQLFIDAGMDDYLAKPLEPAQLIEKIGELIG